MSDQSIQLILDEMRDLRTRMDQRFDDQDKVITGQGKQLTELATQMKSLIGNGQPGKIQLIESSCAACKEKVNQRLTSLESYRIKILAYTTVIGGLFTATIEWFGHKH